MLRGPVLVLFILLSPAARAFYCFEASPVYLQLGQAYFESNADRIEVRGDEEKLEVLENLQGDWEGYLSELICEGTDKNPEPYYQEAEVEAEVRASNTALFLLALNKEYEGHYFQGDKVFLMNKGSMFSLRINDQFVSAHERERRGLRYGSQFVEVYSEILIHNKDEISVEWLLFSNGVFVYSQRLTLERD